MASNRKRRRSLLQHEKKQARHNPSIRAIGCACSAAIALRRTDGSQRMTRIGIADAGFAYDGAELAVGEAHLWIAPDGTCLASEDVPSLLPPDERAEGRGLHQRKGGKILCGGTGVDQAGAFPSLPGSAAGLGFCAGIAWPTLHRRAGKVSRYTIQHFAYRRNGGVPDEPNRPGGCRCGEGRRLGGSSDHRADDTFREEQRCIGKLTGDAWLQRFFEYWTLKEAYAKRWALGLPVTFGRCRSTSVLPAPPRCGLLMGCRRRGLGLAVPAARGWSRPCGSGRYQVGHRKRVSVAPG